MILNAKDYNNRANLEAVALSAEKGSSIIGTREELAHLLLDDTTTVHGLKCTITDSPTAFEPQRQKVDRGEVRESKLNGQII